MSALNQNLQENLAGLQVVQLSERQRYNLDRYQTINARNRDVELRSIRIETLYGAFTDSVSSIALGLVVWYGAGAVLQEHVSLGGVILFTRFIDMLFHPIVVLGEQTNILFRAMASGERIFQALDWDEKIHEPAVPVTLPSRLRGEVEFRHVNFAYDANVPVLRDVSFTIRPGEKLAIVGPTGSGKSTLIRLLGRFYDFADDQIFLDGVDLNHIHTRDLRRRIGVVLQDFHIFSGTIYDNIALGDPAISRERAVLAARTVNAHDFITSLPDGYDTILSERGQNLSQGQRQLLAFARVLAANPEILVLDEATASIDTETELLIQDALRKLTAGRTSILIAHRLQTIQEADRVLVLHHGRVEELGTHDELLARRGLYYTLHTLQFQAVTDAEIDEAIQHRANSRSVPRLECADERATQKRRKIPHAARLQRHQERHQARSGGDARRRAQAAVVARPHRRRQTVRRGQTHRARTSLEHRLRGVALPEHRRVLEQRHRDDHVDGLGLHARVPLLRGRYRQSERLARRRRTPQRGRSGAFDGAALHRADVGRSRRSRGRRRGSLRRVHPRDQSRQPDDRHRGADAGLQRRSARGRDRRRLAAVRCSRRTSRPSNG